jgi:hypothetical protein
MNMLSTATLAAMMLGTSAASAAETREQFGSWAYLTIENKMDDTERYVAYVEDAQGLLALKCDAKGPGSVYVGFYANKYLGSGRYPNRAFKYRIDDRSPVEQDWNYDRSTAHLFDKAKARAFAGQLIRGTRVIGHAYTYEYHLVEAELDLTGAATAVNRVFRDCEGRFLQH